LVRQVFRHFFWVAGSEEKHFDWAVRHFVAHVMPALPAKHPAYAFWNSLEHFAGAVWWQSSASRAFLMQSRVAWLNGCGANVVVVVEVVVVVVAGLMVVVVTCACTVRLRSTMQVRNPTVTVFDGRNMVRSPWAGRRACPSAARAVTSMV
jgi:hypothetical protein